MLDRLNLKIQNIVLIDFNYIFKKIEKDLLETFFNLGLLENLDLKNKQIIKFFLHYIILGICNEILSQPINSKTIIYFNKVSLYNLRILKFVDENVLIIFVEKLLQKISKLLPIKIFIAKNNLEDLAHNIKLNNGRSKELVNKLMILITKSEKKKFSFENIKKFVKKNDLTFLSNTFFDSLKSKQLLMF